LEFAAGCCAAEPQRDFTICRTSKSIIIKRFL